jgi:glutathione S-transferase
MSGTRIVLHQFQQSHFNEKARWGLDWKGLPHRRVSHLPGPHLPQTRRLSGQTATPVLDLDAEVVEKQAGPCGLVLGQYARNRPASCAVPG